MTRNLYKMFLCARQSLKFYTVKTRFGVQSRPNRMSACLLLDKSDHSWILPRDGYDAIATASSQLTFDLDHSMKAAQLPIRSTPAF